MRLRERLSDGFENWVASRHQPEPPPRQIRRGRCYILPTRPGYVFAFMLLAMLLGAMNYSNSMAFALTFLLGGMGMVAMHHTNANLLGLTVSIAPIPGVFAGEPVHIPVTFSNDGQRTRFSILCAFKRADLRQDSAVDCPPGETALSGFDLAPKARGVHPLPRFAVATEFPLGLFQAWSWLSLRAEFLVFPRPADTVRPIPAVPDQQGLRSGAGEGRDDFSHLRDYRQGDAPRSIHWRRYPHTGRLAVKTFAEPMDETLWLDWDSLSDLTDSEERLSQLCRWVLDCENGHTPYGLRLPQRDIPPGQGYAHRQACLEALARFSVTR